MKKVCWVAMTGPDQFDGLRSICIPESEWRKLIAAAEMSDALVLAGELRDMLKATHQNTVTYEQGDLAESWGKRKSIEALLVVAGVENVPILCEWQNFVEALIKDGYGAAVFTDTFPG